MDKLEHYLDQVCRGIGGPRALRHHIRRELREHLRDALAEHKAAGLTEEDALARALADFGKPEEVRSELEAAHGHRLMAVVIDKALEWKEKTMKAKLVWTTWAHLVLVAVIGIEVFFITIAVLSIVPRFNMFVREGWIGLDRTEPVLSSVPGFLRSMHLLSNSTTWLILGVVIAWGLFEWRVKSENKTFMRLSALGTAALGLLTIFVVISSILVVTLLIGLQEAYARAPEPIVINQISSIDKSASALEQALERKDWQGFQKHLSQASSALRNLNLTGAAAPALASLHDQPKTDALRAHLKAAEKALQEAQGVYYNYDKDAGKLEAAIKKFQAEYEPVREAVKQGK
jgi:hypothetical protein